MLQRIRLAHAGFVLALALSACVTGATSTSFSFRLSPSNVRLQLDSATSNWQAWQVDGQMADTAGKYHAVGSDLVLTSDGVTEITLQGAAGAQAGDEGTTVCPICKNPQQRWHRLSDL